MYCRLLANTHARLTLENGVQGLKTAVIEGHDIGGTCVNRGCVPSKALLAASGRVREMQNSMHLKAMGIQVGPSGICCYVWSPRKGLLDNPVRGHCIALCTSP